MANMRKNQKLTKNYQNQKLSKNYHPGFYIYLTRSRLLPFIRNSNAYVQKLDQHCHERDTYQILKKIFLSERGSMKELGCVSANASLTQ